MLPRGTGAAPSDWTNREWPPAVARFDTARWVRPEARRPGGAERWNWHVGGPYWGEAMIQSPSGTPGWWRPAGPGSLSVNWTHRGLGGFRGTFRLSGADLVGGGEWFRTSIPASRAPRACSPCTCTASTARRCVRRSATGAANRFYTSNASRRRRPTDFLTDLFEPCTLVLSPVAATTSHHRPGLSAGRRALRTDVERGFIDFKRVDAQRHS